MYVHVVEPPVTSLTVSIVNCTSVHVYIIVARGGLDAELFLPFINSPARPRIADPWYACATP